MLETAVRTAGLVLTSIVPVVNAHVELALSVNWASDNEPAPIVRTETAPSRPTTPRLSARRCAIRRSGCCKSMENDPFPILIWPDAGISPRLTSQSVRPIRARGIAVPERVTPFGGIERKTLRRRLRDQ